MAVEESLAETVFLKRRGAEEAYACAAKDDRGRGAVLIVNRQEQDQSVRLELAGMDQHPSCCVLDASRTLTEVNHLLDGVELKLPRQSVLLLRFG